MLLESVVKKHMSGEIVVDDNLEDPDMLPSPIQSSENDSYTLDGRTNTLEKTAGSNIQDSSKFVGNSILVVNELS